MVRIGWLEKWTLRFAVVGLLFLALSGFEGVLMRTQLFSSDLLHGFEASMSALRPGEMAGASVAELFYAMLTAHPVVGIYGFAYMCVMGAFYFLVPFLLQKPVRYKALIPVNFVLQIAGVMICWAAGFFGLFNALYTLYWPLPVAYDRTPLAGSVAFGFGLILIEANVLLFAFNLFATVLSKSNPHPYNFWEFLRSAFGIPVILRRLGIQVRDDHPRYQELPVFLVAVGRGSIDTVINAVVLLSAGALILIYGLPALLANVRFNPATVDALLYKNWFWWGLDMVADGNVLMYTAGTWYLLTPLLTGRKLYGEAVVRTVILFDLLVSMFVWSHHLLSDMPQPGLMRLLSGQFVTWGEFFTMGLTIFAVMMTIWLARPLRFTPALKFVMASLFGFSVGAVAGLIQANTGLNLILHNTQWVIGPHAHFLLLGGLGSLLFAVIYALLPLLTKLEVPNNALVNIHLWGWVIGTLGMTYSMGLAGTHGMLRRTLYANGEFSPYMLVALGFSLLIAIGFIAFLLNVLSTLGVRRVLSLVLPDSWLGLQPAPAEG